MHPPVPPETSSKHRIVLEDAHEMATVEDGSVHLVVTSPPYPMIEMWDDFFCATNDKIAKALKKADGNLAFELMHQNLDGIWHELRRILVPGGIACINVGDATRAIQGHFRLYANHARVISAFQKLGFSQLPTILWRKTTNAPNKFMGSGMLPPGAYVTLEHEYILIFRNGSKRDFPTNPEKELRRQCAYFWEERNIWFSDVWMGLPGTIQNIRNTKTRLRSAAFPLELPYRLINMFSIRGDTIVDPFLGSGTTMLAAMCSGRNSIGYEIDHNFKSLILERISSLPNKASKLIEDRLQAHREFIDARKAVTGDLKYKNDHYGFSVMTRQEQDLYLAQLKNIQFISGDQFAAGYAKSSDMVAGHDVGTCRDVIGGDHPEQNIHIKKGRQLKLF